MRKCAENVEPFPYSLSTLISPFIISRIFLVITIPRPVPCIPLIRSSSALSNGTNSFFTNSGVIPYPVSLQVKTYSERSAVSDGISFNDTDIFPPSGVYLIAFPTIFIKICCRRRESPMTSSCITPHISTKSSRCLFMICGEIILIILSKISGRLNVSSDRTMRPDSILDTSSTSLIRDNR